MHRSRKGGKCIFFSSIVSFGLTALVTNETHLFPEAALNVCAGYLLSLFYPLH